MSTRILVAGDHFNLPKTFADAIRAEVGDQELQFSGYQSPWPGVPFGNIGEVMEASGSEDEVITALRGGSIFVANHAPLTEKILAVAPDLRLAVIARGEWLGNYYEYNNSGQEFEGSAAGLIGYGAIGSQVARMLHGFGCNVLVYDPCVTAKVLGEAVEKVELAELLSRSRIVSLHARATAENKGMIGATELAMMPKGTVLINCARGSLVQYDTVCDALDSAHLWGAGFDMFPEEPVSAGSRLLRTPHLVMTPHIAGASKQTAEKAAKIAAEEVRCYLSGEPLRNCANPEAAERREQ